MTNAIEIRDLTKQFGNITALENVDLTVPTGSVFGFLGPNGAGKTTTLRILAGLAKPTSGNVTIADALLGSGKRPSFGFLPDTPNFYGWMTAQEFLDYIGQVHGLDHPPIKETLSQVGLEKSARRKIGGFSRGMKQRLGLAQAILARPKVLLLDEPVSALDPAGRKEVLEIMTALRGEMTVFFSTHILNDAERICDEVAILDKGKLLLQSDREALLNQYALPIFEVETIPNAIDKMEMLKNQISALPYVEQVDINGTRLKIQVNDREAAQTSLVRHFDGIPITRFEMVGASLEDVFLRLTNGETTSV